MLQGWRVSAPARDSGSKSRCCTPRWRFRPTGSLSILPPACNRVRSATLRRLPRRIRHSNVRIPSTSLQVVNEDQWQGFCRALKLDDLMFDDDRFEVGRLEAGAIERASISTSDSPVESKKHGAIPVRVRIHLSDVSIGRVLPLIERDPD